mmetsp:Transcript_15472/g.52855  ORF Transcript_15472/g.52855 Transcript_15472/m.52855 type:complete len:112 (+) Transcript_15472:155-490(+)
MSSGSATLQALQQRKDRLEEELRNVEKQVYDLETSYLNDSSQQGNVLRGFEGFLAAQKANALKRARNFKVEDRLFSLSSKSSQATDELVAEQEAARTNRDGGRSHKAGGGR